MAETADRLLGLNEVPNATDYDTCSVSDWVEKCWNRTRGDVFGRRSRPLVVEELANVKATIAGIRTAKQAQPGDQAVLAVLDERRLDLIALRDSMKESARAGSLEPLGNYIGGEPGAAADGYIDTWRQSLRTAAPEALA